jgi:preprotein translocase subunit YajC
MTALFADLPVLLAQEGGGNGGGLGVVLLNLLPILPLVYLLFYLPQQQQKKKQRAMIDGLKKNDKVLTLGGIYGTVMSVDAKNDKIVLRVDDERGVKLAVTTASVGRVIESSSDKSSEGS